MATWGFAASADGSYTAAEWWALLGVLVAAVATYTVTNEPMSDEERGDA